MISKHNKIMTVVEENEKKQSYLTINAKNETPTNLSVDKTECVEELLESDKIIANVKEKSLQVTNEVQVQQLSFGVDRLLNRSEDTQFKIIAEQCEPVGKLCNEAKISVKCCDNANSTYSCCSYPKCSVTSRQSDIQHSRHLTYAVNSWQAAPAVAISNNKIQDAFAFMDSKNIIRPTPIRALGNTINDSVPESYSSVKFQSPIIHSKTPVSLQTLSHSPSFVLSSLVAPLCGIKPLQFTTTKFSTQPYVSTSTSRFRSKTPFQFDLPVVQPNITSLRPNVSDHLAYNNNNNNTIPNNNTTNINNGNANRNIDNAAGNVQNLNNGKRKRSWSRAVFSNLQRKGLEIQFQQQKYITKPDRRKLAARLNLTDAQVKVWFQNRRMKWRHTRENLKSGQEKQPISTTTPSASHQAPHVRSDDHDLPGYSTDGSSSVEMSENENESDEIDVVE